MDSSGQELGKQGLGHPRIGLIKYSHQKRAKKKLIKRQVNLPCIYLLVLSLSRSLLSSSIQQSLGGSLMAAVSSPPCPSSVMTHNPCSRVDLVDGFSKSFDFCHFRPPKCRTFELKKMVASVSTHNAVSVSNSAPMANNSK